MSPDQNSGRVAVITGASSGIGEATARALVADGHRVALLARRADRIHAVADELGNGAIAIEADVTDRDSIAGAAERVQQELGGADILVNNAGVMPGLAEGSLYQVWLQRDGEVVPQSLSKSAPMGAAQASSRTASRTPTR